MKPLLALLAAVLLVAANQGHAVSQPAIHRAYSDGPLGQLHLLTAGPKEGGRTPIVLFHETPASSNEYVELIRVLARDRFVVAIDTPGYGMSDGPAKPLDMAGYVAAMTPALEQLGIHKAVAFGFHTGAVIALEAVASRPDLFRGLAVGGFPYRTKPERRERLDALPRDGAIAAFLEKHHQLVDGTMVNGAADVAPERRAEMLGQMSLSGLRHWYAYEAVWLYDYEQRLPALRAPALFLAPHEMLYEQTRAASKLVPGARLVELPEAREWVLQRHAEAMGREITRFADGLPAE